MSDEADYNPLSAELEAQMKAKRARVRAQRSAAGASAETKRFGDFELVEEIGEGPSARVYRVLDAQGRAHALKILRRAVVAGEETAGARATYLSARREQLCALRHPHLLTVEDILQDGDRKALLLELREDPTLDAHLRERVPLPFAQVARVGAELSEALLAVHAAGLVHNDVEPRNVWWSGADAVLAEISSASEFGPERSDRAIALSGTPQYMAPELLRGEAPTPASDVYALGALLFFAATRKPPFKGPQLKQLRESHAAGQRPRLDELRPDLPSALIEHIESALAVDPARRPSDLAGLAAALRACSELDPAAVQLERASGFAKWWGGLPAGVRALVVAALLVGFVLLLVWRDG